MLKRAFAALWLAAIAAVAAPGQEITVLSAAATMPRTEWVEIGVPAGLVPGGTIEGTVMPQGWRVVAGRMLGTHTRMVSVRAESVPVSEVQNGSIAWEEDDPGDGATDSARGFRLSSWVADEPEKLVPSMFVEILQDGQLVSLMSAPAQPEVIYQDNALRVVRVQSRLGVQSGNVEPTHALFSRFYLYIFSGQDVVPFDAQLVFSDATSADLEYEVRRITLRTGEFHKVDLARKWGISAANLTQSGLWASHLLRNVKLLDGVRPVFTGKMFCLPKPSRRLAKQILHRTGAERIASLIAATEGEIAGCVKAGTWDGRWLALKKTPEVPPSITDPFDNARQSWSRYITETTRRSDYLSWKRPRGLNKRAGDTGSQEDFGMCKGEMVVTAGFPLGVFEYLLSVSTQLRATGYYEHDLSHVSKANRTKWVTWSQHTHSTSGDYLGKGRQIDHPSYGWTGIDDQHFSVLNEQAAYALTGKFWLRDLLQDRIEARLAATQDRSARAIGRTFQAMANDYLLSGDARLLDKIAEVFNGFWGYQERREGPIKYYAVTNDPRALVDAEGQPVSCVNIWQQGLLTPGLIAAYNITGDARLRHSAKWSGETVAQLGYFELNSGYWQCTDYTKETNGYPAPPNDGAQSSSVADWFGSRDAWPGGNVVGYTHTTNWFHEWTQPSLYVLLELNPSAQVRQKTQQIVDSKGPPSNWAAAAWRAIKVR